MGDGKKRMRNWWERNSLSKLPLGKEGPMIGLFLPPIFLPKGLVVWAQAPTRQEDWGFIPLPPFPCHAGAPPIYHEIIFREYRDALQLSAAARAGECADAGLTRMLRPQFGCQRHDHFGNNACGGVTDLAWSARRRA